MSILLTGHPYACVHAVSCPAGTYNTATNMTALSDCSEQIVAMAVGAFTHSNFGILLRCPCAIAQMSFTVQASKCVR